MSLRVPAVRQSHWTCSKLAGLPQSLHFESSVIHNVARFVGVDSTSYTDFSLNCSLWGFMDQISLHVSFLWWAPSQFNQHPCFFMPAALTIRVCSSIVRTSLCTNRLLSSLDAFPHLAVDVTPSPSLYTATLPTMSPCLRRDSASLTVSFADHFRPDLMFTLAFRTLTSLLSLSIKSCLTLVILYSSAMDVRARSPDLWISNTPRYFSFACNLVPELYSPTLLKLCGTATHLLRYTIASRSIASNVVIGTSYTSEGHKTLGSTLCWQI